MLKNKFLLWQYRTKIVVQTRSQLFRQIAKATQEYRRISRSFGQK
jgi:hypothetical protein